MPQGIMQSVTPCDDMGNVVPNPADAAARTIRFAIDPAITDLPNDQVQLKAEVELALSAIQRLYNSTNDQEFRRYFVQILGASQVGLVGNPCFPEVGRQALSGVVAELIDQEGSDVKNKHLRALAVRSVILATGLLAAYILFNLFSTHARASKILSVLLLNPQMVACFAVMLIGCLLGVTLSYAARTTVLTLKDIVNPDVEKLRPYARLLVSSGWTLLVGYLVALDMIVFEVGGVSTKQFDEQPMVAFVLGAVCGLSNLTLPGVVSKKIGGLTPIK